MALDTTIGGIASDSYGTLAQYTAQAALYGWTLEATDVANETNLRRAAAALDQQRTFIGVKQYQFQARSWPRIVQGLVDGWPVDPDTIPQDVIAAQFELAYLIQAGLDPFATIETSVTSEMIKVGPITIDAETLPTGKPRLIAIEGLLRPYVTAGAGQVALRRA
jgi:hypothetical protein